MDRRDFLTKAGLGLASTSALALAGAEAPALPAPGCPRSSGANSAPLPLVRAQIDRIIAITVCTRPFRAQGPRIETERLGRKTIVHNYGHGGSGWSLSWGSGALAMRHVLETRAREIAVLGCGVIGLTSALLAQRAGLKVRIYAKDRPPDVRSVLATGNWSPNSRFCSAEGCTPEVANRWEEMARISFRTYQFMLGLPGAPIEWRDGYYLSDGIGSADPHLAEGEPAYPDLDSRIADLGPRSEMLAPGTHPFPNPIVRRYSIMVFNISVYSRMLMQDFLSGGGVIETRELEKPEDIARLREKTVINATGYGARALFGDESVIPVRGQIVRLIPQPEVTYGLMYSDRFYMVPRRDAIILQTQAHGDFGSADTTADRAAAERTVQDVAELNARIRDNAAATVHG